MTRATGHRWKVAILTVVVVTLLAATGGYLLVHGHRPTAVWGEAVPSNTGVDNRISVERATGPDRTVVRDGRGDQVALFTDGARTVVVTGPQRTFAEPAHTRATVTTTAWVRLAPQEWRAGAENEAWFRPWLTAARADTSPDVLAVATEYLQGSPERRDDRGVRYAGDASFGPESETDPDGRAENSDFYDYLGIAWPFSDSGTVQPKRDRFRDVDCSGYLRLVFGYRLGYPLRNSNTAGVGLPRRAFAISKFGPGVEVMPNRGVPPRDYSMLQPGDMVFFNSDPGTGPFRTDHSGIFLGVDDAGHYRFISSRSKANGPTFGDTGGEALLDGRGHWAQRFRNARRI